MNKMVFYRKQEWKINITPKHFVKDVKRFTGYVTIKMLTATTILNIQI